MCRSGTSTALILTRRLITSACINGANARNAEENRGARSSKTMELHCEICGEPIESDEHDAEDIVFCSPECVFEHARLMSEGETVTFGMPDSERITRH